MAWDLPPGCVTDGFPFLLFSGIPSPDTLTCLGLHPGSYRFTQRYLSRRSCGHDRTESAKARPGQDTKSRVGLAVWPVPALRILQWPRGRWCRPPGVHDMTIARALLILMAAALIRPPAVPAATQSQTSPESRVASWVLSNGGKLSLHGIAGEFRHAADLPAEGFEIREIVLTGTLVHPRDLERLAPLANLRSLTLPGTMWNPVCCGKLGNVDDSDLLESIAGLKSLESLHVSHHFMSVFKGIRIFDHGIEKIKSLSNLRSLQLKSTRITGVHLDAFKHLERLDATQTDVNDEGLRRIASLAGLRTLRLRSTYVTDEGLAAISGLSGLVELDLADLELTDAGISHLARLENLRVLNLRSAAVTDSGLAHLAGMEQLADLNLYRTRVTNAGVPALADLPSLRSVDLRYSRVTSSGVGALKAAVPGITIAYVDTEPAVSGGTVSGPPAEGVGALADWAEAAGGKATLRRDGTMALSLRAVQVGDRDLLALRHFPSITDLDLSATDVSDLGVVALDSLPSLRRLDLASTRVTDAGMPAIGALESLEELVLDQTLLEGPGLAHLAGLQRLKALSLKGVPAGDDDLAPLAELDGLRVLDLDYMPIGDGGANAIAGLTGLLELGLTGTRLTDAGLAALAPLTGLRRLSAAFTDLTDEGMKGLSAFRELADLDLANTRVTDKGIASLERLESLRRLNLDYTKVSAKGLAMLEPNDRLSFLSLDNTDVDDSAIPALQGFGDIRSLNLYHTLVTEDGVALLQSALPDCEIAWDRDSAQPTRRR